MKTISKVLSVFAVLGASLVPSLAQAQDLTIRLEPGVAVPLTTPQTAHFNAGFDGEVKLDIPLVPALDFVPGVGMMVLSDSADFHNAGTATLVGGGFRLKRPHNNSGHGLTAVSPWVDGELQYVRTGDLNRFGWAVGAGLAAPVVESRSVWVGPFVRYQSVFDPTKAGFDTTDAKVAVVGLSFEFGPGMKKAVVPAPQPLPPVVVPPVVVVPPPTLPAEVDIDQALHTVVQFKVDSSALDATAMATLDGLVGKIHSGVRVSEITVEGYASSDGPLAHNKVLAQHRAEAVVDYMVSKGVDHSKLSAKGMGISYPVASNKTLPGRVKNRRSEVDLVVTVKVSK